MRGSTWLSDLSCTSFSTVLPQVWPLCIFRGATVGIPGKSATVGGWREEYKELMEILHAREEYISRKDKGIGRIQSN